MDAFVMSWEEFQVRQTDWIAKMAEKNYPIDMEWYKQALMWDRMDPDYPSVSFEEALEFLREYKETVYFMSEDVSYPSRYQTQLQKGHVAQAAAHELAALIEEEWFDDYRLGMQNMYNPEPVLPGDLYVFDSSMKWCVVFTHETTDWESEIDDPMKAAASRYCILCQP